MLVKTINQFGRHSSGAEDARGGGPGHPTPIPDGCVGSGGLSPGAEGPAPASASVLLLEKERVASAADPGPGAWLRLTSRSLYFCIETGPRNINIKYDWITD